jgi:hypothetical protein
MRKLIAAAATCILAPTLGLAGSVDLSNWIENGYRGNNGAGTWNVAASKDTVLQTINGEPTVFFNPNSNAQGTALKGSIQVKTSGDDDFIGFVLGYQDGEMNSTNADFWLIDWKQGDQGAAVDGLALSHVTGDMTTGPGADPTFWAHSGVVSEKQRATNLGSTGWLDNKLYNFELTFTSSLIEVFVDGSKELSLAGSFTDGAFGFYNYSQSTVEYAGITEDVLPPPSAVPLPASLPLILAGLGALGLARRRTA